MKCANCGSPLQPDDQFCAECAHPVAGVQQPATARECSACGAVILPEDDFCGSCGQRLWRSSEAEEIEVRCSNCGSPLEPNDQFCAECGHPANSTISPAKELMKCSGCGAQVTPADVFCSNCGQGLGSSPAIREAQIRCPNCDRYQEPGQPFCEQCGNSLDATTDQAGSQVESTVLAENEAPADKANKKQVFSAAPKLMVSSRLWIFGATGMALAFGMAIYLLADLFPTTDPTKPRVLISDSFNRQNADRCGLGKADLANGGSGVHHYLPLFSRPGSNSSNPIGADLLGQALYNNGLDYGGVQLSASADACTNKAVSGEDLGQDLNIRVNVLAPSDALQRATQAGPYCRSQAVASGENLLAGNSNGYWFALESTGEVKVIALENMAIIAASGKPDTFDSKVYHTIEIAVQSNNLEVALDGRLLMFMQAGNPTTRIALPPSQAKNDGATGLLFGASDNRGSAGGQRADDLIITTFQSLQNLPLQNDFKGKSMQK